MCLKVISHQGCINLIQNRVKTVISNIISIEKNTFLIAICNLLFFQLCYPSEIILICWLGAQETFIVIINVENNVGNCDRLSFIKKKKKM